MQERDLELKGHLRTLSRAMNKRVCFACASAMCLARRARTWSSSGGVDGLTLDRCALAVRCQSRAGGVKNEEASQKTCSGYAYRLQYVL